MEAVSLVPMKEEHLGSISELERLCFSRPWSKEALRQELSRPDACFLVAVRGGEIAGYAGMHCVCGECYVANVAVFPRFRRQGMGRKLVSGLVQEACRRNGEFITLEVRPSNFAAVELYSSLGFERAGLRRGFYESPKEDGLIMTLRLEDHAKTGEKRAGNTDFLGMDQT